MTIRCEIASQDRLVYEDDVDMVVIPGLEGQMGVLPKHSPLMSLLGMGAIKVRKGNEEFVFAVTGGLVEIQPDIITILADAAESIDEIDIARAEEAKKRAEKILAEGPGMDTDEYLAMEAALRRSNLRLEMVNKYRAGRGDRTRSTGSNPSGDAN